MSGGVFPISDLDTKRALIAATTSGAHTVVAAIAGKRIRVTQVVLIADDVTTVKFQSHTTPTDLTGTLSLGAHTGFAPGWEPNGHFETLTGEALDINLGSSSIVGGWLTYLEIWP